MVETSYSTLTFLRDYRRFLGEHQKKFLFWILTRLVTSAQNLVPVYVLGLIVNFFADYSQGEPLTLFYIYLGALLINEITKSWLRLVAKYRLAVIALQVRTEARIKGFDKLMEFDLAWHEKETSGKKLTRISTGAEKLREGLHYISDTGTDTIINTIGILGIFATLSWKYLILAICYASLHFVNEYYHNKKRAVLETKVNRAKESAAGFLVESSTNIMTAKTLGLRNSLVKRGEKLEKQMLQINLASKKIGNRKWRFLQIIGATFWALFLFILGKDVAAGFVSVGMIVIYSGYFNRLTWGLIDISKNADLFVSVKYGLQRMMEIFHQVPELKDDPDAKNFPSSFKVLEVKDLDFKYKNKEVLKKVSFSVKKGEKIGIVGRSGSGKSTLFKLLIGVYSPTGGQISLDRLPWGMIKHESLTSKVSIALQDTELFNLSLRENVSLISPKSTKGVTLEAMRIAQLGPVIAKLPKREETLIGEKGFRLSGGERQRIGIARAILKDAQIILLDEATSNLDSKTEALIHKGLKKNLKDKTVIMTAHRLSTLKDVDRIIVFKKGKLVEEGTYKALLKQKGVFYQLHKLQSKKK